MSYLHLILATTLAGGPIQLPRGPQQVPTEHRTPRERLLTDQEEDGTVWVRGESYKLRVCARGVSFIPRERRVLGSRALELGVAQLEVGGEVTPLRAECAPVLVGRQVMVDRGPVVEVWDLEPRGARQSFVLRERPAMQGDVVLRIPVAGDVTFDSDVVGAGLLFRSTAGALVHYGDVATFDARARAESSPSRFDGTAIELRVSAAFLESADFPLTIDPFIGQFAVDLGTDDPTNGDAAVDVSTGVVLTVMEDTFSSGDRDIIALRHDVDGFFLDEVAVDISGDDTVTPAVACYEAADHFYAVWTNLGNGLFNPRRIEGRLRHATSTAQGNEKRVSTLEGNESDPDIGGPRSGLASSYMIVWSAKRRFSGGESTIHFREVDSTGRLAFEDANLSFGGDQTRPVINKSTAGVGRYIVVYQEASNTGTVLMAHSLLSTGESEGNLGQINLGSGVSAADVAGENEDFLVLYQKSNSATEADIIASTIRFGLTEIQIDVTNLSSREPSGIPARHQFSPAVALTSEGFVYSFAESPTAQDFNSNMFAGATSSDLTSLVFLEGRVPLFPAGIGVDSRPRIASSPGAARAHVVWSYVDAAGDKDVRGALYQAP